MEEKNGLYGIRREYDRVFLDEQSMNENPVLEFQKWLKEAIQLIKEDAIAMVLSTVSKDGNPSSRIVLLKQASESGFTFFTNYESRKGLELKENSNAALLFYWKELDRQVRIEGTVSKTSEQISEEYFNSRPVDSRISAITSRQSRSVENRAKLEELFYRLKHDEQRKKLKRPPHWGGYVLRPDMIEFWQGRPNRLHDRIVYQKNENIWERIRLAP